MKTTQNRRITFRAIRMTIIVSLLFLVTDCTNNSVKQKEESNTVNTTKKAKTVFWQIKAIHPDGKLIAIKAVDGYGNTFDVKAIQDSEQKSLIDIKAFIGDKILPVKILTNNGKFTPLKAIDEDGTLYNIKAISPNGDRLNIMGVKRSGNIIHIKAIDKNGNYYGVKAISPAGELNDVKGIKTTKKDLEYVLYGAPVYAHVKAISQTGCVEDNFLWHIVAIHPDGYTLEVKALDKEGNAYDVKAIKDSDQRSLLDIKAFVGSTGQLPVKLLISNDTYKPLKAIGENGTLYDIKAITPDGKKLDIKGVGQSGNIIHIKAINAKGEFYGVKALSPKGELNDVKGIKMFKIPVETTINGVKVYAHVKALSQAK